MLYHDHAAAISQSVAPPVLRPCSRAVAVPPAVTAALTVIWAITIGSAPELAPIVDGSMKKIAALFWLSAVVAVHAVARLKPGDAEIAPGALPS